MADKKIYADDVIDIVNKMTTLNERVRNCIDFFENEPVFLNVDDEKEFEEMREYFNMVFSLFLNAEYHFESGLNDIVILEDIRVLNEYIDDLEKYVNYQKNI